MEMQHEFLTLGEPQNSLKKQLATTIVDHQLCHQNSHFGALSHLEISPDLAIVRVAA
jgi:ABC-type microcin C transport system duplicated ATPase subunit YejF